MGVEIQMSSESVLHNQDEGLHSKRVVHPPHYSFTPYRGQVMQ
jgi:hypothetical protein